MALLLKASAGALIVVLITWLSRSRVYYLAGLVPLFPTFTLIAHYTVAAARTTEEFKTTVLFTMLSVIPYFLYLAAMYFLADRLRVSEALLAATGVWLIAAAALVGVWARCGQ